MNRFLTKIYAYRFLGEFIVIVPLFAVMFADHGLSTFDISILFVIWSGSRFLLQIPTGVIADLYSRKLLLFAAHVCIALCFTCWFLFPVFWGFLVGFVLWGTADALISGTFEALVYDELKSVEETDKYVRVSGRASAAYFIGTLLAAVSASIFIMWGYVFMLLASAAVSLVAGITALFFPSVPKTKKVENRKYLVVALSGFRILKENPVVRNIVIIATISGMISKGLMEFWTLIATQSGVPHQGLGILMATIAGGQTVAGFVAHRYEKVTKKTLYCLFVLEGLFLLGLAAHLSIVSLVLAVLFTSLSTLLGVLFSAQLQHSIPSEIRATILSVNSLMTDLGILLVFLVFGFLASSFSYAVGLGVFGAIVIAIGFSYLLNLKSAL